MNQAAAATATAGTALIVTLNKTKEWFVFGVLLIIGVVLLIGGAVSASKFPPDDKATEKEKELKKDTQWYLIVGAIIGAIHLVFSIMGYRWYRHFTTEIVDKCNK